MKTHLDLFSGIGGFALAASWAGYQTIGFCEIEDYPRRILSKRFPGIPVHRDVRELDGSQYTGCDLITGGYPCQPFSQAGQRRGAADDRHLWPEMYRIIKQARPASIVAENVAGHITLGLDDVLADLESEGYATRTLVLPACAKNAPHRRDRCWVIARNLDDTQSFGSGRILRELPSANESQRQSEKCGQDQTGQFINASTALADTSIGRGSHNELQTRRHVTGLCGTDVADTVPQHVQGLRAGRIEELHTYAKEEIPLCSYERIDESYWETEPAVGRVANGISNRVDRLRGLGNAIIPQIAYEILKELERHE